MKTALLHDVATIDRFGVDPTRVNPTTPYIGLEHIERGGRITDNETVASAAIKSTKFQFTAEHLLFGKLRPNLGKIARPAAAGVCSTDILPILPGPMLDRGFLFHYLSQPRMVSFAASQATGANLPRLSPTALGKFDVPLPPLAEQRRIAAILDQADALSVKRRQVNQLTDELIRAIFNAMFGHLPAEHKLADGCIRITDGTHQSPQWSSSGVPFLFISNITSGQIDFNTSKYISIETWRDLTRSTPIEVGDVLYSTVGVTYGIPAIVRSTQRFAFQRHIAHLKPRPDVLLPEFLATMLASPLVKRQADRAARGAAQPTVNLADIKKFDVILPPLDEQKAFAARMESVRSMRSTAAAGTEEHTRLFISLQSRAFSGQL